MLDSLQLANLIKKTEIKPVVNDSILELWQQACVDNKSTLALKWAGNLKDFFYLEPCSQYKIVAVDGSQIYPDRHEGVDSFLINIGLVNFAYSLRSEALFFNYPYVFGSVKDISEDYKDTKLAIDEYRTFLELKHALDYVKKNSCDLILLDGNYCKLTSDQNLPVIFYTSMPGTNDLTKHIGIDNFLDRYLLELVLPDLHYTTIFESKAGVKFVYLNTGSEIIRLDFSSWMVPEIGKYLSFILDQINKGEGYPVVLAEAHLQAVISNQERSYFYDLIRFFHPDCKRSFKLQRKHRVLS